MLMRDFSEMSVKQVVDSLMCVADSVTGLTHVGMIVWVDDDSVTLHHPRCVIEDESGVMLIRPMYIGSGDGEFVLPANVMKVKFTPCVEIVDAYVASFFNRRDEQLDTEYHHIDSMQ